VLVGEKIWLLKMHGIRKAFNLNLNLIKKLNFFIKSKYPNIYYFWGSSKIILNKFLKKIS